MSVISRTGTVNKTGETNKHQSRPHIYELDPIRVVTAFGVVAVHVLAFSFFLNNSNATGVMLQSAVLNALHYTRQVFVFVTALALIYVYYGKPFSAKRFWIKRSVGVLLPYSIWSVIYTWVNTPKPFWPFVGTSLVNILTGNASYQLYYILLTLQFYIVLPLFMLFLKRIEHRPWTVLGISFALQLIFNYVDYHYVQIGPFSSTSIGQFMNYYQDRFVLTYQFYFFLGAFAAIYLQPARAFLLRHRVWVIGAFLLTSTWLWVHFFLQREVYHEHDAYVLAVIQPAILLYCIGLIPFFCWVAILWAQRTDAAGHPKGYRSWQILSDASFGVYLIHVLILDDVMRWVVPYRPAGLPVVVSVFFIWVLTAGGSAIISVLLLKVPIISRLVGRAHPLERNLFSGGEHKSPTGERQKTKRVQESCDGRNG